MSNVYRFTVEFDSEAWASLDDSERSRWVSDVLDSINDVAYCSDAEAAK